ncbi:hypothetical protein GcM3_061030 [Golovinomyces cichoracearum]|uniref:Uncharacterized protein n=1 Tax=Golovinomyces cichoracearum TaxID=62708 RepID=A0A420IW27_9PEZI|nr:hypothetical protein GcM3_061030 [Golovinomyces cichoracearum]
MVQVGEEVGNLYEADVYSLSNGILTFAPFIFNARLISETYKGHDLPVNYSDEYFMLCSSKGSSSIELLDNLIGKKILKPLTRPSIQEPQKVLCLNEIKKYNGKINHKVANKRKPYATSMLGNPGIVCTHRHLAILAFEGLINYQGLYGCWDSSNRNISRKIPKKDPLPLVNADAPLPLSVLDRDESYYILVEVNGKKKVAIYGRMGGQPLIVVRNAANVLQLIGSVAPRSVILRPGEIFRKSNDIFRKSMVEGNIWEKGFIFCSSRKGHTTLG